MLAICPHNFRGSRTVPAVSFTSFPFASNTFIHSLKMRAALAVALAAVGLTGAQTVQNYTSALDMTIDPNTVDAQKRGMYAPNSKSRRGK